MEEAHGEERDSEKSRAEVKGLLEILPPVEFCCVYGSTLHPNNLDKSSMIDYIIGVTDPEQWHSENLKMNRNHYASWLVHLGGARLIADIADDIGVGVHFNPFVSLNDRVNITLDNLDVQSLNHINLRAATSASLLLLPSKFTEEDFYAKICSLSYMGDLRMLFAEDRDKVKKIVQGQFSLFRAMYNPFLEEYAARDLLRLSSPGDAQLNIFQDGGLPAASNHVSSLPPPIRSQMGMKLGEKKMLDEFGRVKREVVFSSKEEAAECMRKLLRTKVMVSSARQAVAGLLTVGVLGGARYVGKKMQKAWKSWT